MVTTDAIVGAVAEHYGLSREQVLGGGRFRRERRIAMYLARQLSRQSLATIGRECGGVERTNALHGIRSIQNAMATEPALTDDIGEICERFGRATTL